MSGPKDGRYYILPAHGPKLLAGVDGHGGPTAPVVLFGKNNIVSPFVFVQRQLRLHHSGSYTLVPIYPFAVVCYRYHPN